MRPGLLIFIALLAVSLCGAVSEAKVFPQNARNVIVQLRDANNEPMLTLTRGLDLSGSLQGAGGIGGLLAMTEASGASYYYHHDTGGNVTALMDGAENIVGRAEYDGFNRMINFTGSKAGINPFWQSGQLYHGDIDVVSYLYRPYLPSLQRWAVNDPIQEAGGINLARFVDNSPLNFVDPLGLADDDDKELDARLQVAATGSGMFADLGYGKEEKQKHDEIMCEGKKALKEGAKKVGKEAATQVVLMATTEGLGSLARLAKLAKGAKAAEAAKSIETGEEVSMTSRAARRDAMRQQGIPTSQQPVSQSANASGRKYTYEVPKPGGGTQVKSVQQQTMDSSHPGQGHWEAGPVKTDPATGQPRMSDYDRPKLQSDKSKVDY